MNNFSGIGRVAMSPKVGDGVLNWNAINAVKQLYMSVQSLYAEKSSAFISAIVQSIKPSMKQSGSERRPTTGVAN